MGIYIRLAGSLGLALVLAACADHGDAGGDAVDAASTSTTGGPPPATDGGDPTSGTSVTGTASGPVVTTDDDGGDVSSDDGGSTGAPARHCVEHDDRDACEFTPGCAWDLVFTYNRGINGCLADVVERCVEEGGGAGSTWYRETPGDVEVIGFDTTPDDLPDGWRRCDCDGPLACLCAADAPACPDRLGDFCDIARTPVGCKNSAIRGELQCAWANVDPQGPKDDMCTQQSARDVCIPADHPAATTCQTIDYTGAYPDSCFNKAGDPLYWREHNGVVEVTALCGPVPRAPEWTRCEAVDTPEQPDECKCRCKL